MDTIKKELTERVNDFKTRELPSDAFVLYTDAYHCDIKEKNKIRKVFCLCSSWNRFTRK
jgi:transposase-like protein